MTETFPQLSITTLENGLLRLEDTSYSDGAIADVHRMHVRAMAEQLGLIAAPVAANPDVKTMAELHRDIDRLQRGLLRVREHAMQLHRDFVSSAGWIEADLTYEMRLAAALVDLLDLLVDEFEDG